MEQTTKSNNGGKEKQKMAETTDRWIGFVSMKQATVTDYSSRSFTVGMYGVFSMYLANTR